PAIVVARVPGAEGIGSMRAIATPEEIGMVGPCGSADGQRDDQRPKARDCRFHCDSFRGCISRMGRRRSPSPAKITPSAACRRIKASVPEAKSLRTCRVAQDKRGVWKSRRKCKLQIANCKLQTQRRIAREMLEAGGPCRNSGLCCRAVGNHGLEGD